MEFAMATEDENVDENQLANDVIAVLRNRLDSVGYTEATIKKVFAGNKVRIRVERIIEPYEKPLESVHPQKVRELKERALTRLESKLKKVIKR